jgi:hypothetical protein
VVFFIIETEPPIHIEITSSEKRINEIIEILASHYKAKKINIIKV